MKSFSNSRLRYLIAVWFVNKIYKPNNHSVRSMEHPLEMSTVFTNFTVGLALGESNIM